MRRRREDLTRAQEGAEEVMRIRAAYAERARSIPNTRYSLFDSAHLSMHQELEQAVLGALDRHGMGALQMKRILDIGCGTGQWLREFVQWGALPGNLYGIDLIGERIEAARTQCAPGVHLICGDATAVDQPDGVFDVIIQMTTFTSILDQDMRRRVAEEVLRLLNSEGIFLWYDYHVNNPRNPHVRAVTRREIVQLFSGCSIELRRITLAPPVARAVARRSRHLYMLLAGIPWLRTHYFGVISKRAAAARGRSGRDLRYQC